MPDALPRTRILIVDDHPIVRSGIRQLIEADPSLEVCCESDGNEAALHLVKSHQPNLVIVDLSLSDGNGMKLVRAVRDIAPDVVILVLSMHDELLFAERALRAGAHGYIMKHEAIDGLLRAIREVLAGRIFVSDRIAQRILEQMVHQGGAPGARLENLTDRELEVFELTGRGLSASAIAEALGVSLKTVDTYRAHIKAKLDLKDAADVLRLAASWTEGL